MKKILFATTALVATASVAAADVTFSGYGRFGVMYTGSMAQSATNTAAIAAREALIASWFDTQRNNADVGDTAADIADEADLSDADEASYLPATGLYAERTIESAYDVIGYLTDYNSAVVAANNQILALNALNTGADAVAAADVVYRITTKTGKVALLDASDAAFEAAAAGEVDLIDVLADAVAANTDQSTFDALSAGAQATAVSDALADALLAAANASVTSTEENIALAELVAAYPAVATDAIVSDMMITSRLRLNIDASAESDSGITFGARIRIQQGEGEIGTANAARFYAKTGGLEVGVGNIYGALESMAGQYPIDLGLTGLGYEYTAYGVGGADAYSSGGTGASGRNGVEVMYSMGDFSAHISASDADAAVATSSDRVAATVAYTMSDWTVALGMQDSDAATDVDWTATVGGKIGGVSLGLGYAETNAGVDRTVMTVGMDVGAATNVEAYIADQSDRPDTGYGIDFNHSLGGGTSLRGGVASLTTGQTIADFGVRFNF